MLWWPVRVQIEKEREKNMYINIENVLQNIKVKRKDYERRNIVRFSEQDVVETNAVIHIKTKRNDVREAFMTLIIELYDIYCEATEVVNANDLCNIKGIKFNDIIAQKDGTMKINVSCISADGLFPYIMKPFYKCVKMNEGKKE